MTSAGGAGSGGGATTLCADCFLPHGDSVLSGYGPDNELDMELEDEEEMDGFTEDRYGQRPG